MGSENLQSNVIVTVTDTCTANLSTFQDDSVLTSNLGFAWVGQFNDTVKYFGSSISSISYLPFSLPTYTADTLAVFDSLKLSLKCYPDYIGDTSVLQKILVYHLTSEIQLENNGYLYSNDSFLREPTPIATIAFYPKPTLRKNIVTNLSVEFGQSLLDTLMRKINGFSTDDQFSNYFKGLALVPDPSSKSICSFVASSSEIFMSLYYHIRHNHQLTNDSINISLSSSSQFNQIKNIEITNSKGKSSNLTGHQTFVQGITGIHTRIEFPYVNYLEFLGKFVTVTAAQINMKPILGSYKVNTLLPDSLYLSLLSKETNDQLSSSYVFLTRDYLNNDLNTRYGIDITSFIKNQATAFAKDKQIIALSIPLKGTRYPFEKIDAWR